MKILYALLQGIILSSEVFFKYLQHGYKYKFSDMISWLTV